MSNSLRPMDSSPTGSAVPGILQARILEWVAMPSSRGPAQPRDSACISYISCIGRRVLCHQCHLGNPNLKDRTYLKKKQNTKTTILTFQTSLSLNGVPASHFFCCVGIAYMIARIILQSILDHHHCCCYFVECLLPVVSHLISATFILPIAN